MTESKTHDFDEDLEWGQEKQEEAIQIFKSDLAEIINFTESHHVIDGKHKFDVKVESPNIEIKSSKRFEKCTEIPIETVNVGDENAYENGHFKEIITKGWIYESEADWILFYYPKVRNTPLRYCNFKELQKLFSEIENAHSTIINKPTQRNEETWCSGFKMIPWQRVKDDCFNSGTIYNPPKNQTCLTDFVLPNSNWRWKNNDRED